MLTKGQIIEKIEKKIQDNKRYISYHKLEKAGYDFIGVFEEVEPDNWEKYSKNHGIDLWYLYVQDKKTYFASETDEFFDDDITCCLSNLPINSLLELLKGLE